MLLSIKNIGEYAINEHNMQAIDCMLTEVNSKDMKEILVINVKENNIETYTEEFYKDVIKDALFYQVGNGAYGGGIRLDYYKSNKVKSVCSFCEIQNKKDEIMNIIENHIRVKGKNTFALIKINGKTPAELFSDKFLDIMHNKIYNKLKGKHLCHICGDENECFNTTTFKFYTNDKEVYSNVNEDKKHGVVICKKCLERLLCGKKYVDKYLTSFWLGYKVMFLAHELDEIAAAIYENSKFTENTQGNKFIDSIKENEVDVLNYIGRTKSATDIVFYMNEGNKTFNIYHKIESILPSRFTFLSNQLRQYDLRLFNVLAYIAAVKVDIEGVKTTSKEKIRIVDSIFRGKKIDRNLFYRRVMKVYKVDYIHGKQKDNFCIRNINKIYNFLVDCGCLEGGYDIMKNYENHQELITSNEKYFDTNEKKAWFILGNAFDLVNYYMRSANKKEEAENNFEKTSLDKNFIFARKFDYNDFVYFSNLLTDKARKYFCNTVDLKNMFCEAKEYMANREDKLSCDEAKYIFFWGIDSYFGKKKAESAITNEKII